MSSEQSWQELLGIHWPRSDRPESLCDQSGECCRGAAQWAPWQNILAQAAQGDQTSRDFLSQYVPYANRTDAEQGAPAGVAASLKVATERGNDPNNVIFYRCRYLKDRNQCQIYEDRPTLCRDFPESPFGSIPACCGYYGLAQSCLSKVEALKQELASLKRIQTSQG